MNVGPALSRPVVGSRLSVEGRRPRRPVILSRPFDSRFALAQGRLRRRRISRYEAVETIRAAARTPRSASRVKWNRRCFAMSSNGMTRRRERTNANMALLSTKRRPAFMMCSRSNRATWSTRAGEDRFIIMGRTDQNRVIVTAFTIRAMTIRIISAREARRQERLEYEKQIR